MHRKNYIKQRLLALLIHYFTILGYLLCLLAFFTLVYVIFLDSIPEYSEPVSHLIAFLTTILPTVLVFSLFEYLPPYATLGKRRMQLHVTYHSQTFSYALLRNAIKFLPWHIGHTGVIAAIYNDYSIPWFMVGNVGFLLAIIMTAMVVFRKDHRHVADLMARTKVIPSNV